jgi:hypothetical protein
MKTERELFEEWASKETRWDLYWSENINQYMDHQTNAAWLAWQASANRQGCKLVPIKCTNNMAHAAKEIDGRLSAFKYGDVWEAMIGACDD